MDLLTANLADRPDLPSTYGEGEDLWPRFMYEDPIGGLYYADNHTAFPEFVMVAVDTAEPDRIAARALSVPFTWEGDPDVDLPVDGWDGVIRRAALDRQLGRRGNLVSAVRPTAKHRHPHMPIAEYAAWSRADGLPYDPWLRVHVRAGGRIVGVCHRAMVIPGTLAEWRSWTGLPFDTSGLVVVPDALVPVHCDTVHEHAAYVEPAVWVHHRLT